MDFSRLEISLRRAKRRATDRCWEALRRKEFAGRWVGDSIFRTDPKNGAVWPFITPMSWREATYRDAARWRGDGPDRRYFQDHAPGDPPGITRTHHIEPHGAISWTAVDP